MKQQGTERAPRLQLGFQQGDVSPQLWGQRNLQGMGTCPQLLGHHVFSLQMNLLAQVKGEPEGRTPASR